MQMTNVVVSAHKIESETVGAILAKMKLTSEYTSDKSYYENQDKYLTEFVTYCVRNIGTEKKVSDCIDKGIFSLKPTEKNNIENVPLVKSMMVRVQN